MSVTFEIINVCIYCVFLCCRFTNSVVYYGLSMSAGSLGGGRYLSVVLSGLVELPGLCINYPLLNRYMDDVLYQGVCGLYVSF